MLPFDTERVQANVRAASTEDLLNRVTAYRAGMEPEALTIIEAELRRRGVDWARVHDYGQTMGDTALRDANGVALMCNLCRAPAVAKRWGWHWLWGKLPLFPRRLRFCEEHRPG